jgi:hypothetical protein
VDTIVVGILILFGLLILLLAIPLDLTFNINRVNQLQGQLMFLWLFGLVRFKVSIPDNVLTNNRKYNLKRSKTKKPKQDKGNLPSLRSINLLQQPDFRRRLYKFIKDLLHAANAHELTFKARIGLGDPADTGQLWAFMGPLAALVANYHTARVSIEPEFMDSIFEIHSHGKFHLVPLKFITVVIAFVFSPQSIHAWRSLRTG